MSASSRRPFDLSHAIVLFLPAITAACRSHTSPPVSGTATATAQAVAAVAPACTGAPESSDGAGRKVGRVVKTRSAPVLDGAREASWDRAPRYQLAALSPDQTRPSAEDFSVQFQPLWDDQHLYLLVELTDDLAKPFDKVKPPHNYDQCEIYFHVGENWQTQPKWNYGGPRQFAYEAFRAPVHLKPTWKGAQTDHRIAVKDGAQGWTAEIALPFAFWGFEPVAGRTFGFELHCNDGDAGVERDNHLAWSDAKNEAYKHPSVIGSLTLCE